jgi:hypothetical protein
MRLSSKLARAQLAQALVLANSLIASFAGSHSSERGARLPQFSFRVLQRRRRAGELSIWELRDLVLTFKRRTAVAARKMHGGHAF